jgi:hypothetical protein
MRKVTEWIYGMLASGREAEECLPGSVAPSMSFPNTFSLCANDHLLVATNGRERAIRRADWPMPGSSGRCDE